MKRLLLGFLTSVLMALPAMAQSFPETRNYFGQALTTSSGATFDSVDFGFWSKYVQICLRADSDLTYIRFATTTTISTAALITAAIGDRMTAPVSTPGAFISGVTYSPEDALPMTGVASDPSASPGHWRPAPPCFKNRWVTRGLVIHSAGNATLDVWAF